MSLARTVLAVAEGCDLPDPILKLGVSGLVEATRRRLARLPVETDAEFAAAMAQFPVAINTADANAQHYELPAEFFQHVLGPRRKYSSCFYDEPDLSLANAEVRALVETARHAGLDHGQEVLELGCGWGSLSLFMAETLPRARITAVSNSHSQRAFIEATAAARGLTNLTVITADMNDFQPDRHFDRVVSVEMFEHIANWRALLERIRGWLKPNGRLFLHVFSHRTGPYRFRHDDPDDWVAQYFFTGGLMPSHGLIRQFPDLFQVEKEWWWDGRHYQRTALDWLGNMDRNNIEIRAVLAEVYGADSELWRRRWRLFFLAVAGLFGHRRGAEWGVSHYRLAPS